jgi:hypothetical protein
MPFPSHCSAAGRANALTYDRFPAIRATDFSTLARPEGAGHAADLLGTALRTTRIGLIDDKCSDGKRENKKLKTPTKVKAAFGANEMPTTILHLLYRLRVRSNCGDSEVFVSGSTAADSHNFARSYVNVTSYFIGGLAVLSEKRLGGDFVERQATAFVKKAKRYRRFQRGVCELNKPYSSAGTSPHGREAIIRRRTVPAGVYYK